MINVFSALALGVAVTADVAVWRYKRESKILNFLFIFIMIFGHPFYFSVAFCPIFKRDSLRRRLQSDGAWSGFASGCDDGAGLFEI